MAPTPQPSPLESHQMASSAMVPIGGGVGGGPSPSGGSISLAMLIDFIIQKTYHELTVLAELLPRKTDMERKIEVFQFASRTRQLFIRLLALVKWANSVSKVDKSANIMCFLDKQSMIFIETADALSRMARETLVNARLPNFHLPAAVEVLTTGTYSRLPTCIRDKIIPPDPITPAEKKSTLQRLSQVIEYQLATSCLPHQMRKNRIENGRVKFIVDHEFEASLTLMGDGPSVNWRLLDINILVEDKETGDGKTLVHPLQVSYIHQLLQTRLVDCTNPLLELYMVLHTFCQSLQLEVLHSQTVRLRMECLGDLIRVEEYSAGRSLTISYWKDLASRELKTDMGYRLTVQIYGHDSSKPLQVLHTPPLSTKDSELAEQSIRSDQLSLEKLLVHTIYMRTRARLQELKQELQPKIGHDVDCVVQGSPAVLHLPILSPCLRSEQLLITVDTHTGNLQAHIPQDDPPSALMMELQQTLNGDKSRFEQVIGELRFWITQKRCQKTLQHLPVTVYERLPLICPADNPINKLDKHKLFLRLHKHPNWLLIVEFKEKAKDIDFVCHLAIVKGSCIDEPSGRDQSDDPGIGDLPKMYLKVEAVTELDSFVLTHGPFTAVRSQEAATVTGKRKIFPASTKGDVLGPSKRAKHPAYLLPDLSHVVALCDERIPFNALASALTKRGILHHGLSVEAQGTGLALKLVKLPGVDGLPKGVMFSLCRRLIAATIRMQVKGSKAWVVEFLFNGSPIVSTSPWEAGQRLPVYLTYDVTTADEVNRTVDAIVQEWTHIATLYSAVSSLVDMLDDEFGNFSSAVTVRSYNYKKIMFSYGPSRSATASVTWKAVHKKFSLSLGCAGQLGSNPHSIVRDQLEFLLNQQKSVGYLARVLHETYEPFVSIAKLPSTLHLGVLDSKPTMPLRSFTVIPHSSTHVRLAYLDLYCLDVRFRCDGLVSVRDGAFSLFDKSKVIEEFFPTQGLKAFLSKYVDETAVSRRRSQSEDDNPPSPVTLEHTPDSSSGHFLGHSKSMASPGHRSDVGGLRFHAPLTPSGCSNPHTPASPHMANIAQVQQQHGAGFGTSPAACNFSLASPPSLAATVVNPSPLMLPHPSPGPGSAFAVASSPLNPLHAPSPAGMLPTPSPNPAGLGHVENSPFPSQSMNSPAPNTWPGSPGMPRPSPARPGQSNTSHLSPHGDVSKGMSAATVSRVLPQRSWAGAIPTLLTHEAFDALCTPAAISAADDGPSSAAMLSPLERFLGCVYMRRHLQQVIQKGDCLTAMSVNEPGAIHFRCESLQGRVTFNTQHMQGLQLKLSAGAEYRDQWPSEDLQVLERFFEVRVMANPFKPNAIHAFGRLLNAPFRIVRDLVQIMKLELIASFGQQNQLKWSVQFALTVPPSAPSIIPVGSASVLTAKSKMLFFLHIRRLGVSSEMEGSSLTLPLVYDVSTNLTQLAELRDSAATNRSLAGANPLAQTANMMLKRFAEFGHSLGLQPGECSIFPAIRDVLSNLTMPNEPQPLAGNMQQQQQQPGMNPVNVPLGMASGPQQTGVQAMAPMGPSTMNPMQMPAGPMAMGIVPMQQQAQAIPSQGPMPIQNIYGRQAMGQQTMGQNPMAAMSMATLGSTMNNMSNIGQSGPGMMQ